MKKSLVIASSIILIVLLLSICSCAKTPEPDYANAIAENILQALNKNDYAMYSEHFDEAMKSAVPEPAFNQMNTGIKEKIGDYVSKEYAAVQKQGTYTSVFYVCKFTGESGKVTFKVVFSQIDGKTYVSGLWMDSPNLRK